MLEKKSDFVNICGQFFRQILLQWTSTMLFLKVATSFCEAFDIVFHDQKVFSYVNTLLFIYPILPSCVQ